MERNKFNGWVSFGSGALGIIVFIAWVLLASCATGVGGGPVKLREYMYEGIKFTVEAGAQNITQ